MPFMDNELYDTTVTGPPYVFKYHHTNKLQNFEEFIPFRNGYSSVIDKDDKSKR